ncbi:MAG: hypothetical protein E6G47_05125 [Actinobacteria bacterium]|nr:MAG: hypothetical protein E6G47_05125 [Actinomycetota bacterium]
MITCGSCGERNPDGFRFCGFCGAELAGAGPRTEERRLVTVLFCDLVGFTERSDRADPEDVRAMLVPYHALLKREIEAFGGTLDKFIGDGALGVFGAPTAHEDDAERAVRAALEIQRGMRELAAARGSHGLAARAGVTTGEAVVAFGAAGPVVGESVTGDIVNTASRIQAAAPPGAILVGARTHALTRERIAYEALDPISVRGKAEPLAVWRVVEARAGVTREAPASTFVGRRRELEALIGAVTEVACGGPARLVAVVGEAGVGKSRLVAELQRSAPEGVTRWRRARCLPYGEGVTFSPIEDLIRQEAGIAEPDGPDKRRQRLEAVVTASVEDPADRAWLRSRLGPAAGLPAEGSAEPAETLAAWERFLVVRSDAGPLVLVVEDLHWADDALLDFVDGVIATAGLSPLLVITTARPELEERRPAWRGSIVRLSPLGDDDTADLILDVLGDVGVSDDRTKRLVARSGGNPLFAEELARMLRTADESGGGDLPLPDTMQALIAARLDTLAPEGRSLLQDAAVVGPVFWSGAVNALAPRDGRDADRELARLTEQGFVRPQTTSTFAGTREYTFWHALIRDVAYAQIPRTIRAEKHRATAAWIEAVAADRWPAFAEVLAHHTGTALELQRAAGGAAAELEDETRRFSLAAAVQSMALELSRAEGHLRHALGLTPPEHADRAPIEARLGEAAFQSGRYEEAEGWFTSAVRGFRASGTDRDAADAMIRLSVVIEYGGDPARGRGMLSDAIHLLENQAPGRELARAFAERSGTLMLAEDYSGAIADADRAIELAERTGEREAAARAQNFRGYARVALGDLDGMRELRESINTALALGLGRTTAVSYSNLGAALLMVDGPRASMECGREGLAFAEARGLWEMASFLRNGILTTLVCSGDWDDALRLGAQVAQEAKDAGAEYEEVFAELDVGYVRVVRGEPGSADAALALLARARPLGDPPLLAHALTEAAIGQLASGDQERAAALVEEAVEVTGGDAIPTRTSELGELVRVAIAAARPDLAERSTEGIEGLPLPRHRHALVSARGAIAEASGHAERALGLFQDAAERWEAFGQPFDRAHALFGAARCLVVLGRGDAAGEPLAAARAIFARLGATPLVAEADAWRDRAARPLP